MLACPFVPPARVAPPHEKPTMFSVVVMLLPAVPPVVAVTVTWPAPGVFAAAVTPSVPVLVLIAAARFVAAVLVLELSAKLVPDVDATEIEAGVTV